MQSTVPVKKDLILVGGGHSHALVLRKMGMNPWPADVRITLVTNLADTPYSGMLPCHISGLYDFDTAHIDLRPLTRFANCRLIMDEMVGLDAKGQQILCRNHPPLAYDVLSIDVGSTPAKSKVLGAAEYAVPAKPVPDLLRAWDGYLNETARKLENNSETVATIGIVGGGVGGVEMAFAMQIRLQKLMRSVGKTEQQAKRQVAVHIFQRGEHLAKGRNRWTQKMVERFCKEKQIYAHTDQTVCEVSADAVRCESGLVVKCDRIFWVTNASAPPWLKETDLTLTDSGFLAVEDTLQTCSYPNIFAAGDVATMVNHHRPKAGVFAVRQGPPLYENLKRYVMEQPLKPFAPQRRYLNIIDTDTERAIASWGLFAVHAKWCRNWKDLIDRKFMGLFSDFPEMDRGRSAERSFLMANQTADDVSLVHCSGCGSKVGNQVLSRALARVRAEAPSDDDWPGRDRIHTGLEAPDDAAIVQVPADKLAVHTVDQFSALVDDPYVFGQICVNHCLSDLFAMGATSHSALAIATIPYGTDAKQEETLYQLLSGAVAALAESKTFLVGGHTTEGRDLSLGFACNGWIDPEQVWRKNNLVPGQALILTKALGTGALFAADMQRGAKGRWIEGAIASMLLSNRAAADCLKAYGATACTDVTGFGLAGHLLEMLGGKEHPVEVELDLGSISLLSGIEEVLESGFVSSLYERNRQNAMSSIRVSAAIAAQSLFSVLFDPQTSGGLLASVPAAVVPDCLAALRSLGYSQSCCIGSVVASSGQNAPVTINPL
ncbi:MAG: selenide, water dikinase SelD [Phormidesmis sp.]